MSSNMGIKPTLGRIVHYTSLGSADGKYPPEQQAAIITKVEHRAYSGSEQWENRVIVTLHIFYPTGQFDMADVPFSESYERGHWTWPPRES